MFSVDCRTVQLLIYGCSDFLVDFFFFFLIMSLSSNCSFCFVITSCQQTNMDKNSWISAEIVNGTNCEQIEHNYEMTVKHNYSVHIT